MANEIKTDSPTIGERAVATVTEGVKQGLAGLVIGGAAGAALGGLASYVLDAVKDPGYVLDVVNENGFAIASDKITPVVAHDLQTTLTNNYNQICNELAEAEKIGAVAAADVSSAIKAIDTFLKGDATTEAAKALLTSLGNTAMSGAATDLAAGGAVVGGTLGGAAGGAKGAVEGWAYGNPTKWAERVAAKGTERGLENIMAKAMKEQQDFVAQIEAERKQQGSAPPTLAV